MTQNELFLDLSSKQFITVKCVVCQGQVKIRFDQRRLCLRCAGDIPNVRERALKEKADVYERCQSTWNALERALDEADERLSERWSNYMVAVAEGDPRVRQAEEAAQSGATGAMPELIRMWLKYRDVIHEATLVEEAVRRILEEIE